MSESEGEYDIAGDIYAYYGDAGDGGDVDVGDYEEDGVPLFGEDTLSRSRRADRERSLSRSRSRSRSPQYVQGVTQYQQMSYVNPICPNLSNEAGQGMDYRKRLKIFGAMTGEESFRKAVCQYLYDNERYFSGLDLHDMNRYIDRIKNIEYKNPKAFVVAYIFVSSKRKKSELRKTPITRDMTIEEWCNQESANKEGLTVIDIVRYSRMLSDLLS